ncbi:HAD family hydrolase [Allonocardiopsis opalescens]|uniref:HAD superfamily hydrolase (TIGR01549 family) n=1 Tax=Allonocardiopsis opalescens TaxID=1144618 RepID=A0A2T0QDS2_9ACTN|nr:HAD family hydrolase [Allonocardiopsis opalescens]PRY02094.1 HAD superfamily hydrolase (TIGR01549 family) [Allonocardiopsis opalescens]
MGGAPIGCVALDVGETIIDESRIAARWARRLGVPPLTLFALMGGMVATGRSTFEAFTILRPDFDMAAELERWRTAEPEGMRTGFDADDLYPDTRPALAELRAVGLRVVIAGNQPVQAGPALVAMDLPADAIHTSEEWGVAKPDPAFFAKVAEAAGRPPGQILYVGDRVDNDVVAAADAGMRTALLRRGPFGYLHAERPEAARADAVIDGLGELPGLVARLNAETGPGEG